MCSNSGWEAINSTGTGNGLSRCIESHDLSSTYLPFKTFKTLFNPHPHTSLMRDMELLEKIQHHATKFVNDIAHLNPCHTRAMFSRRTHSVQEKCRTPRCAQYNRKHHRSIAVASAVDTVGSHRTPRDGEHFEDAQNKRRPSAF